ncbi:MAG: TadE family protein [Planctomycetia bacterium]
MLLTRRTRPGVGFFRRTDLAGRPRRGAALLEVAVTLPIFLMVMYGIIEYGRFVYTNHVLNNAARVGARYAVCHGTRVVIDSVEYSTGSAWIMENRVKPMLYGQIIKPDPQSRIYASNAAGAFVGPYENANFGEFVTCEIQQDYRPIVPNFTLMPALIPLTVKATMRSDAN